MSLMFGKARTCNIVTIPEHEPAECNIVVLGATGSGKSALTVKFLTKRFISEYDPNLEDTYSSEEIVDQQPVQVRVMDTADQDGPVNCERYLAWASAFLVVYSIDNKCSFEICQQYLEMVTPYTKGLQPESPIILLGNKVDMERYRQHVFHEAVREARREAERSLAVRPLYISEDKSTVSLSPAPPLLPCYKELPTPTTAKVVTVKSSRAQSKRRAPTLTLLKDRFKIF
ncbi:ras-like protein family member 12 isoform X2 [Electrophorus electricus]|uniref:ras-like protein family member 12 isoform X2 n=1 Tax=Electrophorus electricus TaxID=8005 RepID=UPI0015D05EE7|nr:ras-like protein family member 12 isoform X2 [Electrophorus electricus]